MIINLFAILLAYLFGSISSAIIVCRLLKLPDPRTQGSQNPGATNVLRIGGKKAAAITLFGDVLKGLIAVVIAKWIGLTPLGIALVTLAVFLGHLFPIFFGFKGGKGVATFLGCILALSWPVGLAWLVDWLIVALIFRYSSLASLLASLLTPIYIWYLTHNLIYVLTTLLMSMVLIVRHRRNVGQLIKGEERKIS
ncbi:MAG TPA: glycerol-3-phosphate 1-O-acyltransferase PlsY [Gammaproteobacteria bacterium]|nr:glycerol-3-phosphate 1-O-acyltransferase PlsY [Gammaproteobacteria bacterium]